MWNAIPLPWGTQSLIQITRICILENSPITLGKKVWVAYIIDHWLYPQTASIFHTSISFHQRDLIHVSEAVPTAKWGFKMLSGLTCNIKENTPITLFRHFIWLASLPRILQYSWDQRILQRGSLNQVLSHHSKDLLHLLRWL